ncbi:MAG TPA: hypothetical protein VFW96_06015 [Thermomicrobiales bacterium]|nr:hypothetical protein [Thermomicrobiales bacterium]
MGWLAGGGLFRWLTRGILVGSIALLLLLVYVVHLNAILAALIGFTALILGLLVVGLLVMSGRLRVDS